MSFPIHFAALILGVSATVAQAQPTPDESYRRIVTEFIKPGFTALSDTAERHSAERRAYCAAPSPEKLGKLAASFHLLADAWAKIEIIRSGPASEDFRHERFYFWPERKNAVERGLTVLLDQGAILDAGAIRKQSAAVQGLPALERLLYANGEADTKLGKGPTGQLRCRLGTAISENAAELASEMATAWASAPANSTPEARAALATDIVTAYAILKDTKIETVVGKDEAAVKPRAAEFWRSGRSMRDIMLNLAALLTVNDLLFPDPPEDVALPYSTRTALSIAESIKDLAATASGVERNDAVFLRDAVGAAEDRAVIEVPSALGVTIGFNSLDGD